MLLRFGDRLGDKETADRVGEAIGCAVDEPPPYETEAEPVPIYGAPAEVIVVAYGVAPVERFSPTDRMKRWNRDHDQHPFRETRLLRLLGEAGLSGQQIDTVLDCLDDCCPDCWDGGPTCQCRNDR